MTGPVKAPTNRSRRYSFTERQVLDMRQAATTDIPFSELAKIYGCTSATINQICGHLTYRQYGGPKVVRRMGNQPPEITYPEVTAVEGGEGQDYSLKFNRDEVLAIRHAAAQGVYFAELGRKHGCSTALISLICSHKAYFQYGGPKVYRVKGSRIPVIVHLPDDDPLPPTEAARAAEEAITENVAHEVKVRQTCKRCGILIFDSLKEALSYLPLATEINVAVGLICTACHNETT